MSISDTIHIYSQYIPLVKRDYHWAVLMFLGKNITQLVGDDTDQNERSTVKKSAGKNG
jgi:hypothetical protein